MTELRSGREALPAIAEAETRIFSDAWGEKALLSHAEGASSRTLAAYLDGVFAGYLLGTVIPPEGEVYRIAVLPEARGKGVGDALLSAFLGETPVCFLEVRESNSHARRLYERHGFVLVGTRRGYYKDPKEDACIYKRETEYDTNTGL